MAVVRSRGATKLVPPHDKDAPAGALRRRTVVVSGFTTAVCSAVAPSESVAVRITR